MSNSPMILPLRNEPPSMLISVMRSIISMGMLVTERCPGRNIRLDLI